MGYKAFEELFEIPLRNGLTKPKKIRGEGFKMVNMGELFAYSRINNSPMDRVPLSDKEKESSMLMDGDLLFARQSLVREGAGQCSIFVTDDEEVCFESHIIRCRLNQEIANPFFYYYFFRSFQGKQVIDAIIEQGAGASGIRGSDLAKLQVPYIKKEIQDEIAEQLKTIDDKIELNRQINQTLEQIAQAIFKSWFVDFEPVKAKIAAKQNGQDPERAAMRAISSKTDEELDQLSPEQRQQLTTTAALFPDELEDSELGEMPKGWGVSSLGEYLEVLETGRRPKGGVSGITEGVPSVGAENIIKIGEYNFGKEKFVSREFFENISSGVVESEDVLLYKDGGKPGEFKPRVSMFGHGFPYEEFAINEHVFRLRSNILGQPYLYLQISHENVLFELKHKGGKAAIPGINQHDLRTINILIPPSKLLDNFNILVHPTLIGILHNAKQNLALSDLREALLPKLLSGEITLSDAQSTSEAVA